MKRAEVLEAVLDEHHSHGWLDPEDRTYGCLCGESLMDASGGATFSARHRAHVATALDAALAAQEAQP